MGNLILGIDPGIALTGFGVVEDTGGGRYSRIDSGCLKTDKSVEHTARLEKIHLRVSELLAHYRPVALALEKVFFNKNTRTALTVGEARGVIMLAAAFNGITVYEYTPLQIKSGVSGDGRADKLQVQKMVCLQLRITGSFRHDDEADALAAALCHLQHLKWRVTVGGDKKAGEKTLD